MRRRILRDRVHRRVFVTLKDGTGFEGVLHAVDAEAFVLVNAKAHEGAADPVDVDGEMVLLRAETSYVQVP